MLKIVYDLIEEKDKQFDTILWVSAKNNELTSNGIVEIKNSIQNFTGVINKFSEEVNGGNSNTVEDIIYELKRLKALLIIDNLETVKDGSIEFIRQVSEYCKIVITSRIGLGQLDYPIRLEGLSKSECILLVKSIGEVRNSNRILLLSDKKIDEISTRLHFKPLDIKWFLSLIDMGKGVDEVLNNTNDLVEFCFQNVYDHLSSTSKLLIACLRAAGRPLTRPELRFLTDSSSLEIKKDIIELLTTTIIKTIAPSNNSDEKYSISDSAIDFLKIKVPLDNQLKSDVKKKISRLVFDEKGIINLNINNIVARNTAEAVLAKSLKKALSLTRLARDFDLDNVVQANKLRHEALNIVKNCKEDGVSYSEVYCVSAFIQAEAFNDIESAEDDYKDGLRLDGKNLRLLYFYSRFLIYTTGGDIQPAKEYLSTLCTVYPDIVQVKILYTECLTHLKEYENAEKYYLELKESKIPYDEKIKRHIVTDLIDNYRKWAEELATKGEYDVSKVKFIEALKVFSEQVLKNSIDKKLIKNTYQSVRSFINRIDKLHNQEHLIYILN